MDNLQPSLLITLEYLMGPAPEYHEVFLRKDEQTNQIFMDNSIILEYIIYF